MQEWLAGRLLYPLAVWLRGESSVFAALRELQQVQWSSPGELAARQERRLIDILRYAHDHSPYYRDALRGLSTLRTENASAYLENVSLLTKHQLRTRDDALRAVPPPRRVRSKTTGGSTGQAVTVLKDGPAIAREMAASWLGYGWYGVHVGARGVRFWGSPHSMSRKLRFIAADLAMNRLRFSAFAFTDRDLEEYWQQCVRFQPRYLYGYVSMLDEFARFVQASGRDGASIGLRAVITTSEVLSDAQRQRLRDVFGVPVQNEYGCGEVGPIAYECEQQHLHVMSENIFVEVLTPENRRAGVGESGEIVVTDLNNRAMPLIRYALGDNAVWGDQCGCGRGFQVLQRIWGRAYDFVQTPSGRRFHGEFFMYYFEELRSQGEKIDGFQVVQRAPDHLLVRLVVPGETKEELDASIARELGRRLGDLEVSTVRVPVIERAPSGKMRLIINESEPPRARRDVPPVSP